MHKVACVCVSHSVISDSLQTRGLQGTWFLCPWDFLGKNTGEGCHCLLQGVFLTQGSSPQLLCLLPRQVDSLPLYHLGRDSALYVCINGLPCGSAGEASACNAGDLGPIPGLRRSPGDGKGHPLQCSGLENSVGCVVHGVAKSQTRQSDF